MSRVTGRYLRMMAIQSSPLWLVTVPWSQAAFYISASHPPAWALLALVTLPTVALAVICWHWDR